MNIKNTFFAIAGAVLVSGSIWAADAPKYIFYFIGDGMGMAHGLSAQIYNRMVLGNSEPITMMRFPVSSASTTHSASSPVTDSSAAGTALAAGIKTRNGMLGMNADTIPVYSIAHELFDKGYGVALVTSVPPDDATPGAFYAHVPNRSMYYDIGVQAAETGYDFIGGSNLRGLKDKNGESTDLLKKFADNNVSIAYGIEQLKSVGPGRVLLLNPETIDYHQIHFTIDSIPGAMTLPDMTRAALDRLAINGRDKFFMMVEGGNIDYGGHANDAGVIVKEVLKFNDALEIAYDFFKQHPDETLIVVTADHETGGMGLGNNIVGYDLHLEYLDYQRISKDRFAEYCRSEALKAPGYCWDNMKTFLAENLGFWGGIPVSEEQEVRLREEFDKSHSGNSAENKTLYNSFNTFTEAVYRIIDSKTGIGWTSNGHTGGLVPVYAIGVGSEKFIPLNDNVDIPAKIRAIVGN